MKVLFQGDSVTEMARNRNNIQSLGRGYPKYAAELIRARHPDTEFQFINRGIAGDQAENLKARWQEDCIAHQPDVVSVMVGVNDTWLHADKGQWESHEYFEECYRYLLTEIKEKTHAKIIMLEQFLLYVPDKAHFREDLDPKIQITRKLAREFADVFVPTDGLFAAASLDAKPTTWAYDGVHPTEFGAKFIAAHYADAFDRIFNSIK